MHLISWGQSKSTLRAVVPRRNASDLLGSEQVGAARLVGLTRHAFGCQQSRAARGARDAGTKKPPEGGFFALLAAHPVQTAGFNEARAGA
jgi:hypothetical protein